MYVYGFSAVNVVRIYQGVMPLMNAERTCCKILPVFLNFFHFDDFSVHLRK